MAHGAHLQETHFAKQPLLPLTHLPELFPKKLTQALGGAAQWVGRLGGTHGDLGLILGFL